MPAEYQPVIFAAGEGSKMFPLTEELPKCLLPVGNLPMIWYVINSLEQCGFQEFIVIVRGNEQEKINQALQTHCGHLTFDIVKIPDDNDDFGTADSLRLINDKIHKDLLIVSCDLFTEAPLHRLIDIHRTYDASMTVMLSKQVDMQLETAQPNKSKRKDGHSGNRDFTSVDSQENRLLLFINEGDVDHDSLTIKKTMLKRYPNMQIKTDLVDCHLYVMKKWLLEYLVHYRRPESVRSDFIPHVVQKQFSKRGKITKQNPDLNDSNDDEEIVKDIHTFVKIDDAMLHAREWSGYQGRCLKDEIKCHAYTTDKFCLRVNTLPSYTYINRQISKLKENFRRVDDVSNIHPTVTQDERCQIGKDCLIGESTSIGNSVTIKKTTIGKHCHIGSNVRIANCVLMNHVTIEDGCVLQGSIICDHSSIRKDCSLTNCQVSCNQTVQEKSELKNETIVEGEMEFDDEW